MKEQQAQKTGDYREELITALRNDADYKPPMSINIVLMYCMLGLGLFCFYPLYLLDIRAFKCLILIVPIFLVIAAILAHIEKGRLEEYKQNLAKHVSRSGLIVKIAMGCEVLDEIFNYVLFPWYYFLGPRKKDLKSTIILISHNIDWYLAEPRQYVNPRWVVSVFGWLAYITVLFGLDLFGSNNLLTA